jgi:peptidoglycan/xylan/chitin deacetylase (PgdA/CDA1 family)/2-polyprenyl-3-methyl-5-hydroxy-6-metoxy-1,4-benzoquinol methylase
MIPGRERCPDPSHGAANEGLRASRLTNGLRLVALELGNGRDPLPLLGALEGELDPLLSADLVAGIICETAPLGAHLRVSEWLVLWGRCRPMLERLANALEERSKAQRFARRMLRELERRIAAEQGTGRRYRLGTLAVEPVECSAPARDLTLDAEMEILRCDISLEGRTLASIELPVCDGRVAAGVLSDAVAVRCAWPILGRFLALGVYPRRGLAVDEGLHDQVGWETFLQELWGRPDLPESAFYECLEDEGTGRVVSAGNRFVLEVAADLPAIEVAGQLVQVVVEVGGAPIGTLALRGGRTISPGELRAAVTAFGGPELCVVAVREALLGRPLMAEPSLRGRLAAAAAAKGERPNGGLRSDHPGVILARRDPASTGTSASRRASFPARAAEELVETATALHEGVIFPEEGFESRAVSTVVYAPDVLGAAAASGVGKLGSHRVDAQSERARDRGTYDRMHFEMLFATGQDPWGYESEYERVKYARTLELLPRRRIARALEIGCAEGHFTAQLAPRVGALVAIDVSEVALARAAVRCADYPHVSFAYADVRHDPLPASFDLVVCSEVLYYVERSALPMVAERLAGALNPGGHLLTAHANVLRDQPDEPGFDWQHEFGAKAISEALRATPSLQLLREIRTPLYRVQLYRRPRRWRRERSPVVVERDAGQLPPRLVAGARLEGGEPGPPPEEASASTDRLPILMYHRVTARGGNPKLAPFRLSPESFEQQLRYLRDTGHQSVDLEEWRSAMERKRPLPGRRIALTFDDGDAEFARVAWPLLQQYGFRPIVFLVAGLVGRTNTWDSGFGEEVRLVDWPEVRRLHSDGVIFGSHSETHTALTGLSNADVVREATRSRRILETELGVRVDAFAYPYGAVDPAIEQLVGACGYTFGLTCRPGRSRLVDSALDLPRVEVSGVAGFESFVASLRA